LPSFQGETETRVFKDSFEDKKKEFLEYKSAINKGREPDQKFARSWERKTVFELLKTRNALDPQKRLDLKTILTMRFSNLEETQIENLYTLATNPFQIEEDARRENNKTVGESKDWWTQGGYEYHGERIWHKAAIAATQGRLTEDEENNLILFMYPFSKTGYHNTFHRLNDLFPYKLPAKSVDYRGAEQNIATIVLPSFAKLSLEELDEIAKAIPKKARMHLAREHQKKKSELDGVAEDIPRYARTQLAREHQMGLHNITLPESFKNYHEFALFLFKVYLGVLDVGDIEQINKNLKELEADVALRQFFVLRDMIKPGQLLASRPEVPDQYRDILKELEDGVAPSDREEVRNVIQRDFGWTNGDYKLVRNLNAGSMGEVWLVEHSKISFPLAVKILTPSKEKKINETLKEMEKIQEIFDWYRPIYREAVIAYEVIDKLMGLIKGEMDFRQDKRNWETLFGFDKKAPNLTNIELDGTVPIPNTGFHTALYIKATKYALAMSYIDGVGVDDPENGLTDSSERKALAQQLWSYLQDKIFASKKGEFPMDLHLGNLMKTRSTNKIVMIDTGQNGKLKLPDERKSLKSFLVASTLPLSIGDRSKRLVDILLEMSKEEQGIVVDQEGLQSKIKALLDVKGNVVDRVRDLFMSAPFHGLFLESSYTDILKSIMTFQGAALRLDPSFQFAPGNGDRAMITKTRTDKAMVSFTRDELVNKPEELEKGMQVTVHFIEKKRGITGKIDGIFLSFNPSTKDYKVLYGEREIITFTYDETGDQISQIDLKEGKYDQLPFKKSDLNETNTIYVDWSYGQTRVKIEQSTIFGGKQLIPGAITVSMKRVARQTLKGYLNKYFWVQDIDVKKPMDTYYEGEDFTVLEGETLIFYETTSGDKVIEIGNISYQAYDNIDYLVELKSLPPIKSTEFIIKNDGQNVLILTHPDFKRPEYKKVNQTDNEPTFPLADKIDFILKFFKRDQAMTAKKPGGIDFNPNHFEIESQGKGVDFNMLSLTPEEIQNMNIEGFIPVIINITPVINIPLLLGIADQEEETTELSYNSTLGPMEKIDRFKAREPEELSVVN